MESDDDLTEFLVSYPQEMAFGDGDPGAILDRYFVPDFEYRNDGFRMDRERLVAHARPARKNVTKLSVEVHRAQLSGERISARYTLRAEMRSGAVLVTEAYLFGRLAADGRIQDVDQVTRVSEAGA
ncbi:nuclear transport factor 2 family protein [Nocardia sp. NPDC059091]|uniref:nuclear transport factor 2 family protein n=1 Tax=unclassified Nocardia TaxID=2637762 RepID=UPI0036BF06F2